MDVGATYGRGRYAQQRIERTDIGDRPSVNYDLAGPFHRSGHDEVGHVRGQNAGGKLEGSEADREPKADGSSAALDQAGAIRQRRDAG
jgi:hypothetical protein